MSYHDLELIRHRASVRSDVLRRDANGASDALQAALDAERQLADALCSAACALQRKFERADETVTKLNRLISATETPATRTALEAEREAAKLAVETTKNEAAEFCAAQLPEPSGNVTKLRAS